jgi:hypothetical protein
VADLDDEEPGEAVEVAVSVGVPDVAALAAVDHSGEGCSVGRELVEVQPKVVVGCPSERARVVH